MPLNSLESEGTFRDTDLTSSIHLSFAVKNLLISFSIWSLVILLFSFMKISGLMTNASPISIPADAGIPFILVRFVI